MQRLVNMKSMLAHAFKNQYAVPQININNLEWIQASLSAANKFRSPIILGVSMGAKKYMGSYALIKHMVLETMKAYKIEVPVCLHLDHGDYDNALEAIDAGFSSIMLDASKLDFEVNIAQSKAISQLCQSKDLSLEIEVGPIGGYEDGVSTKGEMADVNQCVRMAQEVEFDVLAASVGNIHGIYPEGWEGLNFALLKEIATKTKKPLVLHGGSGIDEKQIQAAINLGICKINVNTECQVGFTAKLIEYFHEHHDLNSKKTYDPRNYLKKGMDGIQEVCENKFALFGSANRY